MAGYQDIRVSGCWTTGEQGFRYEEKLATDFTDLHRLKSKMFFSHCFSKGISTKRFNVKRA